jgi:hypothetical protein
MRARFVVTLGAVVVVTLLYWQPIHSYLHTKQLLSAVQADVSRLQSQKRELRERIATVGTGLGLLREARRLGFVKPTEQLFIVKGIAAWRRKNDG